MIEKIKPFIISLPSEYILASLIGTVLSFITFLYFIKKELKEEQRYIVSNKLTNQISIDSYASAIKQKVKTDTIFNKYKEYLKDILSFIAKYLGELKIISYYTLEKHFVFSLFYTFFFFYITWFMGGDGKIGNLVFLTNSHKLINSLYMLIAFIFIFIISKKRILKASKIKRYQTSEELEKDTKKMFVSTLILIVILISCYIFLLNKVGIFTLIIYIIAGTLVYGTKDTMFITFLFLGLFSVGIEILKFGLTNYSIVTSIFFILLPFINSIFDYMSMYFSRNFAYKILKTQNKWKIFADLLIDTAIAIVLLYLLAIFLFYVLGYFNNFISDEKFKIPIEYYKITLINNPFNKDVLWITFMLASTLIPTAVHLALGIYALLALKIVKPHLAKLADKLFDLSKENDNDYKKHLIAKELVLYEQSLMLKVYLSIGVVIVLAFVVTVLALLIKIGISI